MNIFGSFLPSRERSLFVCNVFFLCGEGNNKCVRLLSLLLCVVIHPFTTGERERIGNVYGRCCTVARRRRPRRA